MAAGMEKRKVDFTDLVFYLAIASKHARMMVLLVTMSLVAGLVYYVYARPVYRSISTVKYTYVRGAIDQEEKTKDRRFDPRAILAEFSAPHVLAKVQEELGFVEDANNPLKPQLKRVSASFNSEGNIVLDTYVFNKEWAKPFPQKLVETVMKVRSEQFNERGQQIADRYDKELARLEQNIAADYAAKAKLKEQYDPEQLRIELDELKRIPRELFRVRQKIEDFDRVRAKVASSDNLTVIQRLELYNGVDIDLSIGEIIDPVQDPTPSIEGSGRRRGRIPSTTGRQGLLPLQSQRSRSSVVSADLLDNSSRTWEDLERDRHRLEREIAVAGRKYLDHSPKIRTLHQELDRVNKQIETALLYAADAFELSYRKLRNKERELAMKEPIYQEKLKQMNDFEIAIKSHSQGSSDWESMWNDLVRKRRMLEFAIQDDQVNLTFLTWKLIRDRIPVSPPRFKLVLLSFLLGIGLAIGVPFLLEFLDQTVTNMDKLEAETHMKGLGLVPDFEDTIAEAYPLIGSESMTDPDMLENFRVIRTNLVAAAATSKYPQVIMVTSTGPKEGKTVVSSNLALSFAQMGDKTLYIDTNLRRGLVHHLFSVRAAPGLSNTLVEKLDVSEAVRETAVENLSVLPTGDHLDGDIEMLGSTRMQQIIDELRGKYQRIVLDAPPVLGLSETAVMQPVVDGVMMVIWSAFTSTRQIRTAMDILSDNHANFYGFVLNRLDLSATMNRFHYYYYSNHYYNRYQSMTRVS